MSAFNYTSPASALWSHHLPDHCTPTTAFLHNISAYTHTCIPTPLAFISVLLGILSIISWLFAQLPQIIKNFRLRSTSGLSIFFLVEWCLGDLSNLVGAILTHQATWQILIAIYYCFVDFMLVGQWIWYEKLKHGRHLRRMWLTKYKRQFDRDDAAMRQVSESSNTDNVNSTEDSKSNVQRPGTSAGLTHTFDSQGFRTPRYSDSPAANQGSLAPPQPRTIRRAQANANSGLPSPSPRTILFVSMLVCLCSSGLASPAPSSALRVRAPSASSDLTSTDTDTWTSEAIGTAISWLSTFLYLGSRLPQLIKNARLRSTAGLSPLLFLAAFLGNLFYSTSMLANPLIYTPVTPPYGAHGWNNTPHTVERVAWILNALPFFLGAAGVLIMDACVGLQFWLFRVKSADQPDEVIVVVVDENEQRGGRKDRVDGVADAGAQAVPVNMPVPHWRRVSGWMRGWSPAVAGSWASGLGTPVGGSFDGASLLAGRPVSSSRAEAERTRLLDNDNSRPGTGYGAV